MGNRSTASNEDVEAEPENLDYREEDHSWPTRSCAGLRVARGNEYFGLGETIFNGQATRLLYVADVATGILKLEKSCITLTSFISFATNLQAAECGQDSG